MTWLAGRTGNARRLAARRVALFGLTCVLGCRLFPGVAAADEPLVFLLKWGPNGPGWNILSPAGVTTDVDGNVFVASSGNDRILKFTGDGQYLTQFGSFGSGEGQFNGPFDVVTDQDGNIYVADSFNGRIQKFTAAGQYITQWFVPPSGPARLAIDDGLGVIYATGAQWVDKFSLNGTLLLQWLTAPTAENYGVAVGNGGAVYVVDRAPQVYLVRKYDSDGQFITQWGGTEYAIGVATDVAGNVYVSGNQIRKFTADGVLLTQWGSPGSMDGQFGLAADLAVDADGNVFVVDPPLSRVQKFGDPSTPVRTTSWGRIKSLYLK